MQIFDFVIIFMIIINEPKKIFINVNKNLHNLFYLKDLKMKLKSSKLTKFEQIEFQNKKNLIKNIVY